MGWPAAAAAIGGGVISALGSRSANRQNKALAREQMAFQERMSNTAYQRGVADMRAAGINPILAAKVGGASTPSGASATMQNPNADLGSAIGNSVGSVLQANNLKQTNKLLEAQTADVKAGTKLKQNVGEVGDVLTGIIEELDMPNTGKAMRGAIDKVNEMLFELQQWVDQYRSGKGDEPKKPDNRNVIEKTNEAFLRQTPAYWLKKLYDKWNK